MTEETKINVWKTQSFPTIDHHSYAGDGVDMAVMHKQAEKRQTDYRDAQSTIVHQHPYKMLDRILGCNVECMVYVPGFKVGSVATELLPVEEETDGQA